MAEVSAASVEEKKEKKFEMYYDRRYTDTVDEPLFKLTDTQGSEKGFKTLETKDNPAAGVVRDHINSLDFSAIEQENFTGTLNVNALGAATEIKDQYHFRDGKLVNVELDKNSQCLCKADLMVEVNRNLESRSEQPKFSIDDMKSAFEKDESIRRVYQMGNLGDFDRFREENKIESGKWEKKATAEVQQPKTNQAYAPQPQALSVKVTEKDGKDHPNFKAIETLENGFSKINMKAFRQDNLERTLEVGHSGGRDSFQFNKDGKLVGFKFADNSTYIGRADLMMDVNKNLGSEKVIAPDEIVKALYHDESARSVNGMSRYGNNPSESLEKFMDTHGVSEENRGMLRESMKTFEQQLGTRFQGQQTTVNMTTTTASGLTVHTTNLNMMQNYANGVSTVNMDGLAQARYTGPVEVNNPGAKDRFEFKEGRLVGVQFDPNSTYVGKAGMMAEAVRNGNTSITQEQIAEVAKQEKAAQDKLQSQQKSQDQAQAPVEPSKPAPVPAKTQEEPAVPPVATVPTVPSGTTKSNDNDKTQAASVPINSPFGGKAVPKESSAKEVELKQPSAQQQAQPAVVVLPPATIQQAHSADATKSDMASQPEATKSTDTQGKYNSVSRRGAMGNAMDVSGQPPKTVESSGKAYDLSRRDSVIRETSGAASVNTSAPLPAPTVSTAVVPTKTTGLQQT